MRIRLSRSLVAVASAAVAVAALGAGTAHAQADPSEISKDRLAETSAKADPAFLDTEQAASKGVVTSAESRQALTTIQTRIADYVAKNGTKYSFGSYSDPRTGNVVVDTDAPSKLVASLTDLRDDEKLASIKVETVADPVVDVYQRRDDIPAYYGGGGLLASNALCSTGYAVKNSAGTRFMVTAGHCYANGTKVNTESNLRNVGTVSNRALASLGSGPIDMELLGGQSYWGRVFTGGVTSSTSAPVVAAGTAFVGYTNYCHSGRTTGEQCGHTANSITGQVCTATGCKSPVIAYTGGVVQQGGDSGGAFYAKDSNGGIWIRGHVIAGNSSTGFVEPWTQVTARYGVSIVTG
jgi:hypothetical protein